MWPWSSDPHLLQQPAQGSQNPVCDCQLPVFSPPLTTQDHSENAGHIPEPMQRTPPFSIPSQQTAGRACFTLPLFSSGSSPHPLPALEPLLSRNDHFTVASSEEIPVVCSSLGGLCFLRFSCRFLRSSVHTAHCVSCLRNFGIGADMVSVPSFNSAPFASSPWIALS